MAKKILIVDDEPDIIKMLGVRLKANGYEVISAQDGVQAVSVAHREKPDLIILDVKMPAQDGYTVYENLQMAGNTNMIPVIFLTALPPEDVEKKVQELGADGYISKPFDTEDILNKVKELIPD
ncbi:MAG: response regulator [Candidatus Kaelpia aquatica]|nr:response regulator [Candidatus Kaelpia aquatica]